MLMSLCFLTFPKISFGWSSRQEDDTSVEHGRCELAKGRLGHRLSLPGHGAVNSLPCSLSMTRYTLHILGSIVQESGFFYAPNMSDY